MSYLVSFCSCLCFSVLLALRLPRLGKRELILVLFVRLFDLCLFGFVGFLFLLVSGKGCGLWLWHSLDFSLTFFSCLQGTMEACPKNTINLTGVYKMACNRCVRVDRTLKCERSADRQSTEITAYPTFIMLSAILLNSELIRLSTSCNILKFDSLLSKPTLHIIDKM